MIWRAKNASGFTLIELLVVVAILGLALAMVAEHGPLRSPALDRAAVAGDLAGGLREARAKAIATNRPVSVTFDLEDHSWQVGGQPRRPLPGSFAITLLTAKSEGYGEQKAVIRFEPDGSSTGARIDLDDGRRKLAVTVDWLTGNVTATQQN